MAWRAASPAAPRRASARRRIEGCTSNLDRPVDLTVPVANVVEAVRWNARGCELTAAIGRRRKAEADERKGVYQTTERHNQQRAIFAGDARHAILEEYDHEGVDGENLPKLIFGDIKVFFGIDRQQIEDQCDSDFD